MEGTGRNSLVNRPTASYSANASFGAHGFRSQLLQLKSEPLSALLGPRGAVKGNFEVK
jgi:hypothetical protein